MKLEVFERAPGVVEYVEIISERGDRFEMSVLQHLLNREFVLLPNSAGIYSIFALPMTSKIARRLGKIKSIEKHLDDYSRQNRG